MSSCRLHVRFLAMIWIQGLGILLVAVTIILVKAPKMPRLDSLKKYIKTFNNISQPLQRLLHNNSFIRL